jgi:hypothetical protein
MTKNLLKAGLVVAVLLAAATLHAQKVGLKTNTLYWATGTINLGVEVAMGPKTTLDIVATGNPWVFGEKILNRKIWHWTASPEIRFWQGERFNGGFIGVHATTGAFDAGGIALPLGVFPELKEHRYEGWMAGVGASYGWQWYLSPHWNFEATFGFGYLLLNYNKFECVRCGEMKENNVVKHYFGPTRIGLSFTYLFKSKK